VAPQCTRFIYGYMAFAGFSIFFTLTGLIALQLVARLGLALDAVSFTFILYNFAARLAPAGVRPALAVAEPLQTAPRACSRQAPCAMAASRASAVPCRQRQARPGLGVPRRSPARLRSSERARLGGCVWLGRPSSTRPGTCARAPRSPRARAQVVGVTALFFWPAPLGLKQGYLVVVGVVTAYIFTFVPEWTTWVLLLGMALYDLWAVLSPVGPLKVRGRPAARDARVCVQDVTLARTVCAFEFTAEQRA